MLYEVIDNVLHRIECKSKVYFYNNTNNTVYDEDMLPIDFSKCFEEAKTYSGTGTHVSQLKKLTVNKQDLKYLVIFLGTRCNYKCTYCFQQQGCYDFSFNENDFYNKIKSSGLAFDKLMRIEIWGGEPFVYWKKFRSIVKILRERIKYNRPICSVTNGSLFDEEKKAFCLTYKVQLFFSHDGVGQTVYRCNHDYLDNPNIRSNIIDFLQQGHVTKGGNVNGLIMPSIGPHTDTFDDLISFFEKKLYKDVVIRIAGPLTFNKQTKHLYNDYTPSKIELLKNEYKQAMLVDRTNSYYELFSYLRKAKLKAMQRIIEGHLITSYTGIRNEQYDPRYSVAIDTEGNYLSSFTELSTEDDFVVDGAIDDKQTITYNFKHNILSKPQCLSCVYAVGCALGCLKLDNEDFNLRCQSHMYFRQAIFESAWESLFNDKIEQINPVLNNRN